MQRQERETDRRARAKTLPPQAAEYHESCKRRRLVLIPDRMSAENEQFKLKRQHGTAMIAATISKNGKGPTGTYTLAHTLRESRTEQLF